MTDTDRPLTSRGGAADPGGGLTLGERAGRSGRRLIERIQRFRSAPNDARADIAELQQQVDALRQDVRQLQHEAHLDRRLQRRVAELTDIMQELVLPATGRDEQRLTELLEDYRAH